MRMSSEENQPSPHQHRQRRAGSRSLAREIRSPLQIPFMGAVLQYGGIEHETVDQNEGERAHGQIEVEGQRQE
jgi:hypothetical protein